MADPMTDLAHAEGVVTPPTASSVLYEQDETAWLELMSRLVAEGRHDELDYPHIGEFLLDMARRDRREVESRLAVLLAHLLKWTYQPGRRTGSWRRTVVVQRQRLDKLLASGTLRHHARDNLASAYRDAIEQAVAETDLPASTFPAECPWTLEQLEGLDLLAE